MIHNKYLILLIASTFALGESAFVESLNKCSVKDTECFKILFQSLIQTLGDNGAPEIGIDKIDPMAINDTTISILGAFNLTFLKGSVEGVKGCKITNLKINIEGGKMLVMVLCDHLLIQGQYKIEGKGTLFKEADINGKINGEGSGKITLEKIEVKLEFITHFKQHDDGDIYLKFDTEKMGYDYQVLGKATLDADHLVVGDNNASNEIIKYINENWKIIMQTFGRPFLDKAMEYVNLLSKKFFDNVSVKHFVIEDLSSYVK